MGSNVSGILETVVSFFWFFFFNLSVFFSMKMSTVQSLDLNFKANKFRNSLSCEQKIFSYGQNIMWLWPVLLTGVWKLYFMCNFISLHSTSKKSNFRVACWSNIHAIVLVKSNNFTVKLQIPANLLLMITIIYFVLRCTLLKEWWQISL